MLLYFVIFFLLLEWFYNHPALRYGGYHLIALLLFIPFSVFIENISSHSEKKINIIIIVIIVFFVSRNFLRISNEIEKYNYNFLANPTFNSEFKNFDISSRILDLKDCTLNEVAKCEDESIASKIKFNRHIFYKKIK